MNKKSMHNNFKCKINHNNLHNNNYNSLCQMYKKLIKYKHNKQIIFQIGKNNGKNK
jgi:hypothetical protein